MSTLTSIKDGSLGSGPNRSAIKDGSLGSMNMQSFPKRVSRKPEHVHLQGWLLGLWLWDEGARRRRDGLRWEDDWRESGLDWACVLSVHEEEMNFIEEFAARVASSGFSAQSFAGPGYESVWAQLKPWLGRITTNCVVKWVPRAASQMPCQIPHYDNGLPVGPCANNALESCLVCGKAVCLNHAFVDGQQGDAICYLCVVAARAGDPKKEAPPPPPPPHEEAQREPDARAEAQAKAWWARGTLGVQEGVSWADVKVQYKKLSSQFHPDRPNGDEQRFKDVQMAYDVLKLVYGEN